MRRSRIAGLVGTVWLSIGSALSADATAIYQYTGHPFSNVSGVYSTSDSISGSLTLASPLAANLSAASIAGAVLAYDFSDGHQTLSGITPTFAVVSTDASGNIDAWTIGLGPLVQATPICSMSGNLVYCDPVGGGDFATTTPASASSNFGLNLTPGTWALVPEPDTLVLFCFGLAGLVSLGRGERVRRHLERE